MGKRNKWERMEVPGVQSSYGQGGVYPTHSRPRWDVEEKRKWLSAALQESHQRLTERSHLRSRPMTWAASCMDC